MAGLTDHIAYETHIDGLALQRAYQDCETEGGFMKKIIFDTDLGGDCDDVTALDLLLSADKAQECELLGVTYSSNNEYAPKCIYAILKQHGREMLPIGKAYYAAGSKKHLDYYSKPVAEAFNYAAAPDYDTTPDAVSLLRRLISENEHVTIIVTGFLTNIAALLKSEGDAFSPLTGSDLMKDRVDEIVIMACCFSHINCVNPVRYSVKEDGVIQARPEYNIMCDVEAAQYTFENCPIPIVCCPFEVGYGMLTGSPMLDAGKGTTADSLSFMAYEMHSGVSVAHGHDSYDPATALYGIYGAIPFFYKSSAGIIKINDDATSDFLPQKNGLHTILMCALTQVQIANEIDVRVSRLFE